MKWRGPDGPHGHSPIPSQPRLPCDKGAEANLDVPAANAPTTADHGRTKTAVQHSLCPTSRRVTNAYDDTGFMGPTGALASAGERHGKEDRPALG